MNSNENIIDVEMAEPLENNKILDKSLMHIYQEFFFFFLKKIKIGIFENQVCFRKSDIEYIFNTKKTCCLSNSYKISGDNVIDPVTGEKYKKEQYTTFIGLLFILNKNILEFNEFVNIQNELLKVYFKIVFNNENINYNIEKFYQINKNPPEIKKRKLDNKSSPKKTLEKKQKLEKNKTIEEKNKTIEEKNETIEEKMSLESEEEEDEEDNIVDNIKNLSIENNKINLDLIVPPTKWQITETENLFYIEKIKNNIYSIKKRNIEGIKKKIESGYKILYVTEENIHDIIIFIYNFYEKNYNLKIIEDVNCHKELIFNDNFSFEKDILPVLLKLKIKNMLFN